MNPGDVAQSALPLTSSDLSLFTLFWQAHWLVKAVMIGLLVASVWVWAIAIDKIAALHAHQARDGPLRAGVLVRPVAGGALSRRCRRARRIRWRRCSSPPCASGSAASRARPRSFAGLQMRIEKVMDVTIAREIERLERRLLVLATVGSAGPFIGLFGTVWGIMTSFQSIAASKNTSLAVVAPGIAEALFATAIGLVAAIPATIFYNKFVSEVNKQAQRLEGFADEFSAILSRQIDERGVRGDRWRISGGSAFGRRSASGGTAARR